jgi:hypothetical protein
MHDLVREVLEVLMLSSRQTRNSLSMVLIQDIRPRKRVIPGVMIL